MRRINFRRDHDAKTVARAARWVESVGGPDMVCNARLARDVLTARDEGRGMTTTGFDSKTLPTWAQVARR